MSDAKRELSFFGKILRALLPLLLILGGGAAWSYFQTTAPVMKKTDPQRRVPLVETQTASLGDARVLISAMGTVTAAKEITLTAQVAGTVQSVCDRFVPGSLVVKGKALLHLDPADYQVAVKKAQSALADAEAALAIEQGSQNIAREELRVLSEITTNKITRTDLALRKPQLAQTQAALTSAQADLTLARLNLSRTRVEVPFNAMIVDRSVNEGAYVGSQASLATLVGTDEFWIEAVLPLDQLAYLDMAHPGGCPVRIRSQAGAGTWEGKVIQVAGKLNASGRMATVIVAVKNPLGTPNQPSAHPLMINDYVSVTITGQALSNVVELPRSALRDGGTVWVNNRNRLDIRKVALAWKGEKTVFIKNGVNPGEQIVMSDISAPVQGMPLKSIETHKPLARADEKAAGEREAS